MEINNGRVVQIQRAVGDFSSFIEATADFKGSACSEEKCYGGQLVFAHFTVLHPAK